MVQRKAFGKMAQGPASTRDNAAPPAGGHAPSPWIVRWAPLIPPGRPVLDVAAGGGRHTAFLASRGHDVTAVDRTVAMLAARFSAQPNRIRIVQADLENGRPWPLPGETFGGVVVTNYLHRPLFPALLAALEPGGILLCETFMVGHERHGRPRRPEFLLHDGELLDVARAGGLSVIAYEAISEPQPAVMQRIAARRA